MRLLLSGGGTAGILAKKTDILPVTGAGSGVFSDLAATGGLIPDPCLSMIDHQEQQMQRTVFTGVLVLVGMSVFLIGPGSGAVSADEKAVDSPEVRLPEVRLFDGKTLEGWQGDAEWFRVEDGAIVGGNLKQKIPHNFFLATTKEYADFELTLEFRLTGEGTNAGVQIRSRRIPDHHEMIGYQADLGQNYWGALYDESRRNKILAAPAKEPLAKVLKAADWNSYRIRCEGRRIQLWINDLQTVDYTEADESMEQHGLIAVQIHGGPPGEARYRNIQIRPLVKK